MSPEVVQNYSGKRSWVVWPEAHVKPVGRELLKSTLSSPMYHTDTVTACPLTSPCSDEQVVNQVKQEQHPSKHSAVSYGPGRVLGLLTPPVYCLLAIGSSSALKKKTRQPSAQTCALRVEMRSFWALWSINI